MSRKLFTDNEDDILLAFYPTLTNRELAKILPGDHTPKQIKWRAKALGVKKNEVTTRRARENQSQCWTNQEINTLRTVYPHHGATGAAKLLDRSESAIRHKAMRLGIQVTEERLSESRSHNTVKNLPKVICQECGRKFALVSRVEDKYEKDGLCGNCRNSREGTATRHWRWAVLERDSNKCQLCGTEEGTIHAHHIFPRRDYPELEFSLDNGIALCEKCHLEIHFSEYDYINHFLELLEITREDLLRAPNK